MTSANMSIEIRTKVNFPRLYQISAEAQAKIRRARKRDRGAMIDRYARRIARQCVKVELA